MFKIIFKGIFLSIFFYSLSSFIQTTEVKKISVDIVSKTLEKGQFATFKAELFYTKAVGKMVTHHISPFEQLVFTNSSGEYKMYDVKSNRVVVKQSIENNSQNSFIYHFISSGEKDMGLKETGYKITSTKKDGTLTITSWIAPEGMPEDVAKAELVYENYLPVYIAFLNRKNEYKEKVYYSKFQKAGNSSLPMSITEILFYSPKDSMITKRTLSNIKINEQVSDYYFNYKIPANAVLVKE